MSNHKEEQQAVLLGYRLGDQITPNDYRWGRSVEIPLRILLDADLLLAFCHGVECGIEGAAEV